MNWDSLRDDDDDDRFFESKERASSVVPLDLEASSSEDEDFDDSCNSFASCVSYVRNDVDFRASTAAAPMDPPSTSSAPMTPNYNIWMEAPGSITERRKRLLQGMGLAQGPGKDLVSFKQLTSIKRLVSNKITNGIVPIPRSITRAKEKVQVSSNQPVSEIEPESEPELDHEPLSVMLVRSRSEGNIEAFSINKQRKEEIIGTISKQRLTRTCSAIAVTRSRICPYTESVKVSPNEVSDSIPNSRLVRTSGGLSSVFLNNQLGAFFLIKNLDTGTKFIVNEYDQDGCWNRLSDLQTGKQLTMDEFEKCVGYSPVVKEVMRRQSVSNEGSGDNRKVGAGANSFVSKSLRMSKRRGVALLKNSIRGVGTAVSVLIGEKERENTTSSLTPPPEQKPTKNSSFSSSASSEWVKVRQTGKHYKELSALHLCQEIQAHEGSIWAIKFSLDARFLASAGEDRIIQVWEVQECEIMSLDGNSTLLHHSFGSSTPDRSPSMSDQAVVVPYEKENKNKGKSGSARKSNPIPEYVHVPETVFSFSEKPFCSFKGHLDAVLDLSWSRDQLLLSSSMDKTVRLWDLETKTCLKLFAHNDYVTCIQFNPLDHNYFISGSLDAKIRLWNVAVRQVVDWTDLYEMVTAASYTPDGQACIIGSHKGNCRMYNAEDCKLSQHSQIDIQNKKKNQAKKITGFQFSPINPTEMLVTSADSQIRILDGTNVTHKFRGFRNMSSQIGASFTPNGKYVICASEDSHVYIWRRDEPRISATGKKSITSTNSHEHFQCKDVSVAIPWPGTIKGDPPSVIVQHSKRQSKRSTQQPQSGNSSLTQENAGVSKRMLPPIPKKNNKDNNNNNNNNNKGNTSDQIPSTPPQEDQDPAQICRTKYGIGESFNSDPSSIRYGDSSSMSAGSASTSSWSSSWSWLDNIGNNNASQTMQATAWGLVSYQLSFTKKVSEAVPMSHKKEVRDFEWPIDELKMMVNSDKEAVNVKDDSNLIEEFGNDGDGEACTLVSAFQANQNAAFQKVRISKHWTL
ncbi:unnamed protein product [Malus baccata var. baccata]